MVHKVCPRVASSGAKNGEGEAYQSDQLTCISGVIIRILLLCHQLA